MIRKGLIFDVWIHRGCVIPRMNLKSARKYFIKLKSFLELLGNAYKHSNSSFLFSLRNKDNLDPFIANIKQGQEQYAICCYSGYGPSFGGGYDLRICNNPQVNQSSYSNFGNTYQLPPGYVYKSEQARNLLAGQYQFTTTEIEIFN